MYPENFARFYDTIYHSMRDSVDNEFFQKKIRQAEGKILEIGVGTGRLFTGALLDGSDIYGLDISEAMLKVLYGKIPHDQHFRISRQSMVDFSLDHRFDLIIAPFRVFMHLQDKNEQIAALNNVHRHLKSGGQFIFDVFVPDLSQLITGLKYYKDFEDEYSAGLKVTRFVSTTPDLINQTITVTFHLEWEEKDGMQSDDWTLPLRFFFRFELEHLVERSDFKTCKIYGDYNGGDLKKDSREFIIDCRKG